MGIRNWRTNMHGDEFCMTFPQGQVTVIESLAQSANTPIEIPSFLLVKSGKTPESRKDRRKYPLILYTTCISISLTLELHTYVIDSNQKSESLTEA